MHLDIARAFTCVFAVCVLLRFALTCTGHGGRVRISAEEAQVAVAHIGPLSERVAVWRTLGARRICELGLVETSGAG